jgi:ketosteroid isomerase-like protein
VRKPAAIQSAQTAAPAQKPRIGIKIAHASGGDKNALEITEVIADTPAERAGLKAGDVILKINGKPAGEMDQEAMRKELAGRQSIAFDVKRGEKMLAIAVTLGEPEAESSGKSAGKTPASVKEEIRTTLTSMEQALLRGDNAGVAACYSDDAVIIGPRREEARGREAVEKYWSSIRGAKAWKLEIVSVEGTQDVIVQRGRSDLTYIRDDAERHSRVECLHVWKRGSDGRLRIAVDTYWPAAEQPSR